MYYRATLFHEGEKRQAGKAAQSPVENVETGKVQAFPQAVSSPAAGAAVLQEQQGEQALQQEAVQAAAGLRPAGEGGVAPSPLADGQPGNASLQISTKVEQQEVDVTVTAPVQPRVSGGEASLAAPASPAGQGPGPEAAVMPEPAAEEAASQALPTAIEPERVMPESTGIQTSVERKAADVSAVQSQSARSSSRAAAFPKVPAPPAYGYPGWQRPAERWNSPWNAPAQPGYGRRAGGGYYPGYPFWYPPRQRLPVY
jgi:hypothetical protein